MYSGFCMRVLVLSLLTFGQHANALCYRSGGSSSVQPLFDHTRNRKLVFASDFQRSAKPEGLLGSYGSSHSEGGQVDGNSPEGSVSSYGSGSLNVRKPTQNSQQPLQTNPNANGVIQAKTDKWDLVPLLPHTGKRFELGIASSKGIIMRAGHPPQQAGYPPQQAGYHPGYPSQQAGYQPGYPSQQAGYPPGYPSQQAGYPSQQAGYQPGYPSQQPGYQPGYLSQQAGYPSQRPGYQPGYPSQRPGYQPGYPSQRPGYQPGYQPGFQPQRPVGLQSKLAMSEFFTPIGGVSGPDVQPSNLNIHMDVPSRTRQVPMSSRHRPRWQQSLVPV